MLNPMVLDSLIEEIEKAKEGNPDLDLKVWNAVSTDGPWYFTALGSITCDRYGPGAAGNPVVSLDPFTTSLDSALMLVPKRWRVQTLSEWDSELLRSRGPWVAVLCRAGESDMLVINKAKSNHAQTPALAICCAALRALQIIQRANT